MRRLVLFIFVMFLSGCASIELTDKNVESCISTKGNFWNRDFTNTFTLNDEIYIYIKLVWDETNGNGGYHEGATIWYKDGKKVLETKLNSQLDRPPTYYITHQSANKFGVGKYSVEFFMDGNKVATKNFEVIPNKP